MLPNSNPLKLYTPSSSLDLSSNILLTLHAIIIHEIVIVKLDARTCCISVVEMFRERDDTFTSKLPSILYFMDRVIGSCDELFRIKSIEIAKEDF